MSTVERDLARHERQMRAQDAYCDNRDAQFAHAIDRLGGGDDFSPQQRDAEGDIVFGREWTARDVLDRCNDHPAFEYLESKFLSGGTDCHRALRAIWTWAVRRAACDALGIQYDGLGQKSDWLENEWDDIESCIAGTHAADLVAANDEVQVERRDAA